eukprot:1179774-Prorocentrum_minimum.AAC.6
MSLGGLCQTRSLSLREQVRKPMHSILPNPLSSRVDRCSRWRLDSNRDLSEIQSVRLYARRKHSAGEVSLTYRAARGKFAGFSRR